MELGTYQIDVNDKGIRDVFGKISKEEVLRVQRACERYGEEEQDVRHYDVYVIETPQGSKILKRTEAREAENYERYLYRNDLPVPKYYGKWKDKEKIWILIEAIPGNDLRDMTDELAVLSAKSLAKIQNTCWTENFRQSEDHDRFDAYWERINRRYGYARNIPKIGEAYALFLQRQPACPRTLSHGDFLEFNLIHNESGVIAIDWGFGGIMPYSLDIARFIAHATETRATFPFYMNEHQKQLFLTHVYAGLNNKPRYERYLHDIRLALLNEYVEFMEADEDESGWYREHALPLSEAILQTSER